MWHPQAARVNMYITLPKAKSALFITLTIQRFYLNFRFPAGIPRFCDKSLSFHRGIVERTGLTMLQSGNGSQVVAPWVSISVHPVARLVQAME